MIGHEDLVLSALRLPLFLQAASLLEPVDRNRDSLIEEWRSLIYATSM